jgi:hypothetical protein
MSKKLKAHSEKPQKKYLSQTGQIKSISTNSQTEFDEVLSRLGVLDQPAQVAACLVTKRFTGEFLERKVVGFSPSKSDTVVIRQAFEFFQGAVLHQSVNFEELHSIRVNIDHLIDEWLPEWKSESPSSQAITSVAYSVKRAVDAIGLFVELKNLQSAASENLTRQNMIKEVQVATGASIKYYLAACKTVRDDFKAIDELREYVELSKQVVCHTTGLRWQISDREIECLSRIQRRIPQVIEADSYVDTLVANEPTGDSVARVTPPDHRRKSINNQDRRKTSTETRIRSLPNLVSRPITDESTTRQIVRVHTDVLMFGLLFAICTGAWLSSMIEPSNFYVLAGSIAGFIAFYFSLAIFDRFVAKIEVFGSNPLPDKPR